MFSTDVLIIGSGIAAWCAAIKLAQSRTHLSISIVPGTEDQIACRYAEGDGVAAVWNHAVDTYAKHAADTLRAGAGQCQPEAVHLVVQEGQQRVKELIDWGVRFEQTANRQYHLKRERGHSEDRILHYHNQTGSEIHRALLVKAANHANIRCIKNQEIVELLQPIQAGARACLGARVRDGQSGLTADFLAKATIITGQADIAVAKRAAAQLSVDNQPSLPPDAGLYNQHGIQVDLNGRTPIKRLYACGSCTYTGFHGARPLPGNVLLETLVFGHRVARSILDRIDSLH